jgi:glycosyltransferase involved in cell wall biosynthesis
MWRMLTSIAPAAVIIHEYSPYTVLGAMLWAKLNRRHCFISSEVGPTQQEQFSWFHRTLQKAIAFCCDGIIARTQDALDLATKLNKPAVLAPYAVSTKSFSPATKTEGSITRPKRFIQVGSLIPRKGIDLLLAAFSKAIKKSPNLELILVGTGDVNSTKHLAESLNIGDKVIIKEFLQPPQVAQEYALSDAFILASRFDTYGVVVHEAAACGLPLLVSKHAGAAKTLVQDGVNGYVIDPFNARDFSDKILMAVSPENQATFSQRSLFLALENDVRVVGHKTADWLQKSIASDTLPSSEEPS